MAACGKGIDSWTACGRGSDGSRGAVRPPPGTRPNRRGTSPSGGGELNSAGAVAAIGCSAATFLARLARTGRAGISAAGIGSAAMGRSGVGGATFFVTRLAATFLTVVLVAAVSAVAFLAAVFVAAFLATRLGAGLVPSSLLLLIRNQLKSKCAVRWQSHKMRVDGEFHRRFKKLGQQRGRALAGALGFEVVDLGPRMVTGHEEWK